MPSFQGSGFSIELPDGCVDTSAYSFVIPADEGAPLQPFITIQKEALLAGDLSSHVQEAHASLQANLEAFRVLSFKAGRHAGADVVLTTVEWGPPAGRISQTQVFYRIARQDKEVVYVMKGTDLSSNFSSTQAVFNNIFRTFTANEIQFLG